MARFLQQSGDHRDKPTTSPPTITQAGRDDGYFCYYTDPGLPGQGVVAACDGNIRFVVKKLFRWERRVFLFSRFFDGFRFGRRRSVFPATVHPEVLFRGLTDQGFEVGGNQREQTHGFGFGVFGTFDVRTGPADGPRPDHEMAGPSVAMEDGRGEGRAGTDGESGRGGGGAGGSTEKVDEGSAPSRVLVENDADAFAVAQGAQAMAERTTFIENTLSPRFADATEPGVDIGIFEGSRDGAARESAGREKGAAAFPVSGVSGANDESAMLGEGVAEGLEGFGIGDVAFKGAIVLADEFDDQGTQMGVGSLGDTPGFKIVGVKGALDVFEGDAAAAGREVVERAHKATRDGGGGVEGEESGGLQGGSHGRIGQP